MRTADLIVVFTVVSTFKWSWSMKTLMFFALFVASVIFGVLYLALGFKARAHLKPEVSSTERSIGWLFWWSFNTDMYDQEGKKMCKRGQTLMLPTIAIIIVWNIVLR